MIYLLHILYFTFLFALSRLLAFHNECHIGAIQKKNEGGMVRRSFVFGKKKGDESEKRQIGEGIVKLGSH